MTYRTLFFTALALLVTGASLGVLAVNKLGGWRYTAHRLITIEAWPTYTQRLSQLELLPMDSAEVIFLGDSHVTYGEWQAWLPSLAVANRGIPGEGIEGLRAFAKTQDLSKAKFIVVQIGTNDLLFHESEVVIELYRGLVEQLDALAITTMYCTLPGVNNKVRWTGIDAKDVDAINAFIREEVAKNDQVIDLAEVLESKNGVLPKGLTDDGVHLRGEGYQRWAREIIHYLNRVEGQD